MIRPAWAGPSASIRARGGIEETGEARDHGDLRQQTETVGAQTVEQIRQDPFWRERTVNQAGVPIRANPRNACKCRNHMRGRAVGETSADLVGSERVRRHPHRRTRSCPLSGVSCGPHACRVRVPISPDRFGYSASVGRVDVISVMAWNSARNSG